MDLEEAGDCPYHAALSAVARDFGWVPPHFALEVSRALRTQERRNLLSRDVVDIGLSRLRALPLHQDRARTLDHIQATMALARRHGLRVADAGYLELALRTGLPLASRDASLVRGAQAAGVVLFKT